MRITMKKALTKKCLIDNFKKNNTMSQNKTNPSISREK